MLAVGVSACGYSSDSKDVVEGESVELGELKYNVTFSRYLNPNDTEDAAYLVGQRRTAERRNLLRRLLRSPERKRRTADAALDADDHRRRRQRVRGAAERKHLRAPVRRRSRSRRTDPGARLAAQQGPIEGSLALFLLPEAASENRPLTLHIPGAEGEEGAEVTLDL